MLVVLGLAEVAAAQDACFVVAGEGERAQHVIGLSTVVRLSASCEYAVAPSGPWVAPGPLAERDTDFLEVFQHAVSQPGARASGDPRVVLARPRARRAQRGQQSLMLRYCAHYLLEEQLAFRAVPQTGGGVVRIDRAGDGCGGGDVELRAVSGAREERLYTGAAEQTLGTSQRTLELPQGDWSIYAARPGSTIGLRIGVFRSQRVVTPLANHLRSVGLQPAEERTAPPLFAARWDSGSAGMLLHPTDAALGQEMLWPELRTAADAGLVWLTYNEVEGADERQVIANLQLEAGDPAAVRLPDAPVREHMQRRYGDAGNALAPTDGDWRAIFRDLAVCLAPSYRDARLLSVGSIVPENGACASLGGLTVLAQAAGEGGGGRFCVRRGVQIMDARGARHEAGENPECFALPAPGSDEAPPYRMAVRGDRISVEGEGLCVLLDNHPLEATDGEYVLDRSGLLEVRQSGGEGCASRQAIARLRLPVIDPEREWHPVGVYAGATEEQLSCREGQGVCPWRVLEHDESDAFAFVRSRHELAFRLSSSPQVAAALSAGAQTPVQLTQDVPVVSGVSGQFEGARESAVVAYVSRDSSCPVGEDVTWGTVRARPPLDIDSLGPDATFYVHLMSVEREDRPVQCLARAAFHVRPSRAIASLTVAEFLGLELGFLGDTQLALFINDPIAMGVVLPLVWFRLTPGQRWVSFDVGGNLVAAAAFPYDTTNATGGGVHYDAELSRLGVSLSWAVTFGVPDYLPRFLSIGGMLHGAAETHPAPGLNPIVSFYVALNLSTLIDLAGGR